MLIWLVLAILFKATLLRYIYLAYRKQPSILPLIRLLRAPMYEMHSRTVSHNRKFIL